MAQANNEGYSYPSQLSVIGVFVGHMYRKLPAFTGISNMVIYKTNVLDGVMNFTSDINPEIQQPVFSLTVETNGREKATLHSLWGTIDFSPYKLNKEDDSFNITYSLVPEKNCFEFLKEYSTTRNPFAKIIVNGVNVQVNKKTDFTNTCKNSNEMSFIASKKSIKIYENRY